MHGHGLGGTGWGEGKGILYFGRRVGGGKIGGGGGESPYHGLFCSINVFVSLSYLQHLQILIQKEEPVGRLKRVGRGGWELCDLSWQCILK